MKLRSSDFSAEIASESSIRSKRKLSAGVELQDVKLKAEFQTCLNALDIISTVDSCASPRSVPAVVLKRALSLNELDDESWLSSSFLDLVVSKFAKCYSNVKYLSVDFARLAKNMTDIEQLTDITGRALDYKDLKSPIVFVFNSNNIHWNLIRVVRWPRAELQLFEPMGMPHNRHGGLTYRSVPREIVHWLDKRCPLPQGKSWISAGHSAIVAPHQLTSYDCGVACLLYAEKCGQGEVSSQCECCVNGYHNCVFSPLVRVRPRTRSTGARRRRTSQCIADSCSSTWREFVEATRISGWAAQCNCFISCIRCTKLVCIFCSMCIKLLHMHSMVLFHFHVLFICIIYKQLLVVRE